MSRLENCVRYLPIPVFAAVLGLVGLGLALERTGRILGWPAGVAHGWLYFSTAVFVLLGLLYLAKGLRHRAEVRKEFSHPLRLAFFPAISMSLILLGAGFLNIDTATSHVFWLTGTLLHLVLTLMIVRAWLTRGGFEPVHLNPAWFLPAVGNILVPLAGVAHYTAEVSWFFFSIGIVFWLVLLVLVLQRLIFLPPLPEKLLPSLFILLAPPAAGFLAYIKLTGTVDVFARILYYNALFTLLLLIVLLPRLARAPFSLAWWAYSFPLAAITIASLQLYALTGLGPIRTVALTLVAVLVLVIAALLALTIRAAARGALCVPEA
jgi:tellurite resistance protein